MRRRVAGWAVHIFREHNKEDDIWAGEGVKGRQGVAVSEACLEPGC